MWGEWLEVEQVCSVTLSEVISSLLLEKREVTAIDIVNFNSKISSIYDVDIDDDDIDHLFCCVEMDSKFNFRLKDKLDYDSVLDNNMTVREFLLRNGLPVNVKNAVGINELEDSIDSKPYSRVKRVNHFGFKGFKVRLRNT